MSNLHITFLINIYHLSIYEVKTYLDHSLICQNLNILRIKKAYSLPNKLFFI